MEDLILNNLDAYGPFAVFLLLMLSGIGISLGEEIIIIPAGALVGSGQIGFWPTLAATVFGVICSDLLWFMLCRRYGTRLLHRRGFKRLVHPRRLLEAKHQMEQRGAWMIVMARFIPGTRTTAITVAGLLHMPIWKFALATGTCVLVTAPAQIAVGMLSTRLAGARSTAELVQLIVGIVMLLLAAIFVLGICRQYARRRKRLPRARARWLRRFRLPRRRERPSADTMSMPAPSARDGEQRPPPPGRVAKTQSASTTTARTL